MGLKGLKGRLGRLRGAARGLGAHAAHIHDGSCISQGAVQAMLMDFVANGAPTIDFRPLLCADI